MSDFSGDRENPQKGFGAGSADGFDGYETGKTVYIRAVKALDVIDEIEDDLNELEVEVASSDILYSVHAADGERLAIIGDRELAFAAARQHEMDPVSVH